MKKISFALVAICCVATLSYAQRGARGDQRPAAREDGLDPTPINPAVDPNVDLFINDWKNSQPRSMYGKIVFRLIPANPAGTAYRVPSTGITAHANINASGKPAKFIYMVK